MRFFRWRMWRYPVGVVVGSGLASLAIFRLELPVNVSLYTAFIIVAIIWSVSSRIPFGIASACLIGIIIVSIMVPDTNGTQSNLREQLAIGTFYSLVAGVILLVSEQFSRPKKKHIEPNKQQVGTEQDALSGGGLADIAIPEAPPASRPVVAQSLQAHRPMQKLKAKPKPMDYKPHLAPHPMLLKTTPPVVQTTKPKPTRPAGSGRTMDIVRPK